MYFFHVYLYTCVYIYIYSYIFVCIFVLYGFFVCLVPPELLEGPGRVEGIEGEEAVIRCQAKSGLPRPTFTFFKVFPLLLSVANTVRYTWAY